MDEGYHERVSIYTTNTGSGRGTTRTSTSRTSSRGGRGPPCWKTASRYLVETKVFVTVTSLFTIYALVGSDIRTLATQKPADHIFDTLTLICIGLFTVEVLLCTLGKRDYFLSFFFILDVVSTVTLVLDLSEVNKKLFSSGEENPESLQVSETGSVARIARVVRVLRLVRIIKLYKAIITARQARLRRQMRGVVPGFGSQEDEEDEFEDAEAELKRVQQMSESRVSKKLSEMTTRRVVCLVLVMMFGIPYMELDEVTKTARSGSYGADSVKEAFDQMASHPGVPEYRTRYDNQLLHYIFYHNWFNRKQCPFDGRCSELYMSAIFWVGITSTNRSLAYQKAAQATPQMSSVNAFAQKASLAIAQKSTSLMYNYGNMPTEALVSLGSTWKLDCPYKTEDGLQKYRVGMSLLGTKLPDVVDFVVQCPDDIRWSERKWQSAIFNIPMSRDWVFTIYFDVRNFTHTESLNSLLTTLCVCLMLTSVSLFFSNDANRLVLNPVENMIAKVDQFRKDPLAAMRVADEEYKLEEMKKQRQKKEKLSRLRVVQDKLLCRARDTGSEIMETVVLEKTIIKLGSLLALGFGEAGADIIAHNLRGAESANVVVMVEGNRVECIIGSTRIRDFSIATEVLQAEVMGFVNQVAEIVHGVVDEFSGAANKNTGDSFLTIWRTSDKDEGKVSKMADMAVLAFTTILGSVHRSPVLATYRKHPGLQQRLGLKKCRVNLNSGLHYGWAIEGAVGSEFKIDASYLSPNVNIAETVERATAVYGVSICVAQSVVEKCTPSVAAKFRLIDRVIMTGSKDPQELFVIDLDFMSLAVEQPSPMKFNWTSKQRFRVRQRLESEKAHKWNDEVHMVNLFNESPEIAAMRFRYTLEFVHVFAMGYQNYIQGEWQIAQTFLRRTRTMLGVEDGPSNALLRYMESDFQFVAPDNWEGVRHLDPTAFM